MGLRGLADPLAAESLPFGGAWWNRGLAALARLYEWAVQREYVLASPVLMRTVTGWTSEVVLVPAPRAKNARTSEVHRLTPRAFRRWVEVGLRGHDANGQPDAGGRDGWPTATQPSLTCCSPPGCV